MLKGKVCDIHGYQDIIFHVIFEVKMYFPWEDIFVANGNKTEAPIDLTCSRVISGESLRLSLLVASLNDLDMTAYDIFKCISQCNMQQEYLV